VIVPNQEPVAGLRRFEIMETQTKYPFWNTHLAREVVRLFALAAGGVMTALGLLVAVTPLPFGAIMMAFGLVVLISVSPKVAAIMRRLRERTRPLDRVFCALERICPARIAAILRSTSPFPARAVVVRAPV
jgi:uncharacterized membrane protein YhaH (DUF805 family)